jgi:hypothetical protein
MASSKSIICVLVFASLSGCRGYTIEPPPKTIPGLLPLLGEGWQCVSAPSGFNEVGVVFEIDRDGVTFVRHREDKTGSAEKPMAVGTVKTVNALQFGVVVNLLARAIPALSGNFGAEAKSSSSVKVSLKNPMHGVGLMAIEPRVLQWAEQNRTYFKPGSRMFFVQEVISASGMDYTFDKRQYAALTADLTKEDIVKVKSMEQMSDSDIGSPSYLLNQDFPERLGICVKPVELIAASGTGGSVAVRTQQVNYDLGINAISN